MTRELLLLRHAKSSWSDPTARDHDRSLNGRGRRDAPRIGRLTSGMDRLPDLVLSSDSRRTRETVALWQQGADWNGTIEWLPGLYHATAEDLSEVVRSAGSIERLMIVAHNPGIEHYASGLARTDVAMPTATLAVFEAEIEDWQDFDATTSRTIGVWRPRELSDPETDATPTPR